MRFVFTHSHAFAGGRVGVEEGVDPGPEGVAEFGDGVAVLAVWRRAGDDIVVGIPAYRTAKGTAVAARDWRLLRGRDGHWRSRPES